MATVCPSGVVTLTVAPGITAPAGSLTVPRMTAVLACENPREADIQNSNTNKRQK